MVRVRLHSGLRARAGVEGALEIEARDVRSAIEELLRRFPALDPAELRRSAVAIDGELVISPWLEPLGERSELEFIGRIGAG